MSPVLPNIHWVKINPVKTTSFVGEAVTLLLPDSFMFGDFTFIICIIGFFPAWLMHRVAHINKSHTAYELSLHLHLGPWRKA